MCNMSKAAIFLLLVFLLVLVLLFVFARFLRAIFVNMTSLTTLVASALLVLLVGFLGRFILLPSAFAFNILLNCLANQS